MKLIYNVDDKPKFGQLIIFAIQQLLAIMAATIAVPAIVGNGMTASAALFGAGVGTIVYQLFTKFKSPVFLGSSFAFIGSMLAAFAGGVSMSLGYLGLIFGAIFAGLVYVILSLAVKFAGTSWINKLMPPVVIGPTVAVIGLSLAGNKISHNYFNFPELRYIDLSDNEFEESIDLSLGRKLSYVDISGSNYRSLIANFDTTGVTFIADGTPLEQIVTSGVEHFNYVVLTNNPLLFNGIDYSLSRVPGSSIAFSYSREWGKLDYIPEWNYLNTYVLNPPLDCITDLEDASSNKLETASSAEAILMEARRYFSDDVFLIYPY